MRIIVTGVTRTGNLGGTAMLCAVEQFLAPHADDFALASILPARDRAQVGPDSARIVNASYLYWLLFVTPLLVVFWPLRRVSLVRALLARLPLCRDFAVSDAVVDLSGIAFVDGRGLALLHYNFSLALPGLFFGVPVHKLSQAMGPFRGRLNRALASWVLSRCATVHARGTTTLQQLKELGIQGAILAPDTSFALDIYEQVRKRARQQLERIGDSAARALIIVSPSAVVNAHCNSAGVDMLGTFSAVIADLISRGFNVALLAHSTNTGISKNDDSKLVRELEDRVRLSGVRVRRLNPHGDPALARALIAEADVFVASRFHSMIAALSQAVPVVTVGWSHKYAEAAAPFGMDDFTIDYSELTPQRLTRLLDELLVQRENLSDAMRDVANECYREARSGIATVLKGRRLK